MTAMHIDWHKECLSNAQNNYDRALTAWEQEGQRLIREKRDLETYAAQIARAESICKISFDRDKFKP